MPAQLVFRENPVPEITVVIPSLDGQRGGNVKRLIEQFKRQSCRSMEIILSLNEQPNGHARNVGIELASPSARYFMFFDDDVTLGSDDVVENLIRVLEDQQIGLVGASQLPPSNSNWKQKWIGYDLGKARFPIQRRIVDTEMATHAGMGCRRVVWEEMGGESDTLVTGTDTDLRDRLRSAGYRVVVAPNTWVFHPLPDEFMKVLRGAIRNGWHQLGYRRVHGFQTGPLRPFVRIGGPVSLAVALLRETLVFFPHIFLANRKPALGFRPLNALFRYLMVGAYSVRAYRER